jgi:hypothetical protein
MDGWTRFLDLGHPQIVFVVLLSLLLPLSIFVGRRNVRVRRLRMIDNLASVLKYVPADGGSFIAPALELVRARYLGSGRGADPWSRILDWLKEVGIYLLPTGVFVLLTACGFALVVGLGGEWLQATKGLLQGLRGEGDASLPFPAATALVLGAAFVGAYIWSIDFLILRIANFDLSPLSFLRAAAHVLMTVFVAWVLCQVVAAPGIEEKVAVTVVLGIAFLAGLYPSLGLNVLIDRLPHWLRLKRDVPEASDISRSFPLDLIDGIDPSIKFRLNQLEIAEVQNLATANPILLYVEAPYGLLEVMDWMAQAQLLAELGPERFLQARSNGVRDIVAFLALGQSEAGRRLLAPLLLPGADANDPALHVRVDSIANKLHVQHLRHWWTVISQVLSAPAKGAQVTHLEGRRIGAASSMPGTGRAKVQGPNELRQR